MNRTLVIYAWNGACSSKRPHTARKKEAEMDKSPWRPSWWNEETHGRAWDKVREVMIRDRAEMRQELKRPEGELDRELQEAAKRAYGADHAESTAAPTPREVYGDP